MMEYLPLIAFLSVFVLIFILRMPIPTGMMAACLSYFILDGLTSGKSLGAMLMGSQGSLHLVAQKTIEQIFTNPQFVESVKQLQGAGPVEAAPQTKKAE